MNENTFKDRIGILLIASHLICFFLVIVYFFYGGFTFDELTTTLALMLPLFSAYTTVVVKDMVKSRSMVDGPQSRRLSSGFTVMAYVFISGFTAYLISIVTLKAFNIGLSNFEQFKGLLTLSETVFGVYIGQITGAIFPTERNDTKPEYHHTE